MFNPFRYASRRLRPQHRGWSPQLSASCRVKAVTNCRGACNLPTTEAILQNAALCAGCGQEPLLRGGSLVLTGIEPERVLM